ncbi:MAG: hypothetical protein C0504_15375 [Candidatus Solibacter sp.]|nr:hypothetical protein [Candidatus Solibacter sp.]
MAITRRTLLAWAGGAPALAQPPQPAQRTQMAQMPAGALLKPDEGAPAFARGRWSMQYFHDKDRESMEFGSLHFSSATRGLATAVRYKDGEPRDNLALRTADGGKTWLETGIGRRPYSLFVLDDANAWIVCDNRLLYSGEGGAGWQRRRLPDRKMLRVHFQSPTRGWAYGVGNVFHETSDGGRTWKPVKESVDLKLSSDNTLLSWLEFVSPKQGMMAGTSRRRMEWNSYLPDWMAPERSTRRRLMPGVIFTMVTGDGGETWRPVTTSAFGDLTKVRLRDMRGASLIAYDDGFDWPSEVNALDLRTGGNEPIFRRRQIHVTDMALVGKAGILVAGIEALGRLRMSSLSGRVKAIYSPNSKDWYDMKVDYRAEGTFARIARVGDDQFWLASNAGMILKLGE